MCVVWAKTGDVHSREDSRAAATAFGSLSLWLPLTGVGLQFGLGNTHLKAKALFPCASFWAAAKRVKCSHTNIIRYKPSNFSMNIDITIVITMQLYITCKSIVSFSANTKEYSLSVSSATFTGWHFSDFKRVCLTPRGVRYQVLRSLFAKYVRVFQSKGEGQIAAWFALNSSVLMSLSGHYDHMDLLSVSAARQGHNKILYIYTGLMCTSLLQLKVLCE